MLSVKPKKAVDGLWDWLPGSERFQRGALPLPSWAWWLSRLRAKGLVCSSLLGHKPQGEPRCEWRNRVCVEADRLHWHGSIWRKPWCLVDLVCGLNFGPQLGVGPLAKSRCLVIYKNRAPKQMAFPWSFFNLRILPKPNLMPRWNIQHHPSPYQRFAFLGSPTLANIWNIPKCI